MKTVLIVNHHQPNCGVMQFALRIWNLVKNSEKVKYIYREMENKQTFINYVNELKPDFILYNWHRGTMTWLSEDTITSLPNIKHYFIFHEEITRINYDKYLFFGGYDFSGGENFGDKKVLLPRPLLKYEGDYPKNEVTNIGCFGFGFWNKGYDTLAKLVNDTFEHATLNFHMPRSHFGDPQGTQTREVESECRKLITNPRVKLNITRDFLDDNGVLEFLAGNDINVFLYRENGEGISSVIDYALSIKRPIAISNSKMFRHIAKEEIIVSDENSIQNILARGTEPLKHIYKTWDTYYFKQEMDNVFNDN